MAPLLDGCTPWPEAFVDRYWAAGHWQGVRLDNLLRGWALDHGPRTALAHGATRVTYAELDRLADRRAAGVRLRGIRPGQRVLVQLPNVPEFVVTLFGLMRAGAVPVLCPVALRAPEVSRTARTTQAVGYVGPSAYRGFDHTAMAAGIAAHSPFLRRVFTLDVPAAPGGGGLPAPGGGLTTDTVGCHYSPLGSLDAPAGPPLARGADEVAFLLVSGAGPDGPRLVPRTHDDYAHQVRAAAERVALTGDDVYLAALPAPSALALGGPGILGTLGVGGTVVLAEDPDPAGCLPLVARERVTVTSLAPADARRWCEALGRAPEGPAPRLLQVDDGSPTPRDAPWPDAVAGCRVQRVFGLAEGFLSLSRPEDGGAAAHGRPLSADDEVRLVGADGREVPEGETGELLVRGPSTPRGRYRAPEDDARSFTPDGYLRTGRLARRTPTGDLLVGSPAGRPGA